VGRILVTRQLTEGGTDPLLADGHEVIEPEQTPSPEELIRYAGEVDGIVCHLTDRIDRALFEAGRAGKLQVVANAAVGYDNIDVPAAQDCGIAVCNTPGVLDDTTADLAFFLILAAARQTTQAEKDLREGRGGLCIGGWAAGGGGGSTPTWLATSTGPRSGWSDTAASAAPWPAEPLGSTWKSYTPPAKTPEFPAMWRRCTNSCNARTSSASMCP
jgi:lactate dehydrogenase-like 2-hydroxyacid dehydrogenase